MFRENYAFLGYWVVLVYIYNDRLRQLKIGRLFTFFYERFPIKVSNTRALFLPCHKITINFVKIHWYEFKVIISWVASKACNRKKYFNIDFDFSYWFYIFFRFWFRFKIPVLKNFNFGFHCILVFYWRFVSMMSFFILICTE